MEPLSKKVFLTLTPPTEEDARSDIQRILDAIGEPATVALSVLREVYPMLPRSDWKVTATLSWEGEHWHLIRLEPGNTTACHYGVAVDLGSTTVCMELIDLNSGAVVCRDSAYNHQIAFGEDILTRVFYAKDDGEKLEQIRTATLESFREVLEQLQEHSGIPVDEYTAMVVSGNTTMMHFFLGLDAFVIFASPYAPHATSFDFYCASELGLPQRGYVYCVPCRANYLGGDILSGMVATGLPEGEEIKVFLDIGTNGELVVGNRHFLLCGAGAAGPALEGGVVKTGMRAVDGAVSTVTLKEGKYHLTTIGGAVPRGICGSGIVDLIATLFLNGKLDRLGKFRPEASGVTCKDGEWGVYYAPGLFFGQMDVDEFLRTKAAANTMVEYILEYAGIPMEQVASFFVAGAFGTHLDKESAVTIGLYPDLPREQIISAGNSSLEGAAQILRDRSHIDKIQGYLSNMEYIQFGEVANFVHLMNAAMALPHTDLSRYPSVQAKLEKEKSHEAERDAGGSSAPAISKR